MTEIYLIMATFLMSLQDLCTVTDDWGYAEWYYMNMNYGTISIKYINSASTLVTCIPCLQQASDHLTLSLHGISNSLTVPTSLHWVYEWINDSPNTHKNCIRNFELKGQNISFWIYLQINNLIVGRNERKIFSDCFSQA